MRFLVLSALTLAAFFTAQAGELNIVDIKRPLDVEEAGQSFSPKCVIENTGQGTVTALITCRIIDRWDMSQDYYDAMSSYPLDPGATTVEFDEFTPEAGKRYNAKFTVQAQSSGDSKEKNFSASGYDVTPFELISPAGWPPFPPFEPIARYAERAGVEMLNVSLRCKIEVPNALSTPSFFWEDSIAHDFAPYETLMVSFPQVFVESSYFTITFFATDNNGEYISHPPLVRSYAGGVQERDQGSSLKSSLDVALSGGKASIRFTLAREGEVSLDIYDVSGKRVADVLDARLGAGEHEAAWNLEGIPRGIYFVRLSACETVKVQKIVIGF